MVREAAHHGIGIYEKSMNPKIKGLYCDNIIWINRFTSTSIEKACILAEELGHYHTSSGDITDQRYLQNRKQEKRARNWAYEKLVSLERIVQAYKARVKNRFELAEHLGVTEDFVEQAIQHYREKFGLYATFDKYTIYFDPLCVFETFEQD